MTVSYKFGHVLPTRQEVEYKYENVWSVESANGTDRLVIAPKEQQITLLREMSEAIAGPFRLMYVLVVPRTLAPAGRFLSTQPIPREELFVFLNEFEAFFESDGRHNLWLTSENGNSVLVYDNHNLIYAEGDLEKFKVVLQGANFQQVPKIGVPHQHAHKHHPRFDADEMRVLGYWEWAHSPLEPGDDA